MKIPLVNVSVGGLEPYFKQFLYFFENLNFSFFILDDHSMFFYYFGCVSATVLARCWRDCQGAAYRHQVSQFARLLIT